MFKKRFFPPEPVIPSRETENDWIWALSPEIYHIKKFPSHQNETKNANSDVSDTYKISNTTVGKWMLFYDALRFCPARGLTQHDYAWQFIKKMVKENSQDTGIYQAKCTTGWPGQYDCRPGDPNGVICCYTENYFNKADVKRAADAIRLVVNYPKNLFYKTDEATLAGKYLCRGHRHVSLYKHTVSGEMFERDPEIIAKWNPVYV